MYMYDVVQQQKKTFNEEITDFNKHQYWDILVDFSKVYLLIIFKENEKRAFKEQFGKLQQYASFDHRMYFSCFVLIQINMAYNYMQ